VPPIGAATGDDDKVGLDVMEETAAVLDEVDEGIVFDIADSDANAAANFATKLISSICCLCCAPGDNADGAVCIGIPITSVSV
jgi:hypothetical protein